MKRRIFFLTVIVALVPVLTFGQSAKKFYKAGNVFVKNLKYEDAAAQFSRAINLEPTNPLYYTARGKVYSKLGRHEEARSDLEKSIMFQPKYVDALVALGHACNNLEDYGQALRHLNRASSIEQRNPLVYPEKVIALIGLERYDQALKVSDTAMLVKNTTMNYYYRGKIYMGLNNDVMAKRELEKAISKDKKLAEPRLLLAELLLNSSPQAALSQVNEVLKLDNRNTGAYLLRSRIHQKNLDYPSAINDISKIIIIEPENPSFYLARGLCYQEFNQHANAIGDFSRYLDLKPGDPVAFSARAKSYEAVIDLEKAVSDYSKVTELVKYDMKTREMLDNARNRLFEINRETDKPLITVASPVTDATHIEVPGKSETIVITGKITDKSDIASFRINGQEVQLDRKGGLYEFTAGIDVRKAERVVLEAVDVYDNRGITDYIINRTETDPPVVRLIAPISSNNGQIYLGNNSRSLFIEGRITDQSIIRSIFIDEMTATYNPNEYNPGFTATINIQNRDRFTIVAEDKYGNRSATQYMINRDDVAGLAENPMGKTWVVFVENSSYESFASLDGPVNDIKMMRTALANYQIDYIWHLKDMTKSEMERFFSIELRDAVRSNRVRSLMIWYAGHGKFINNVGYWIPVDAKRDDEFTYFNINQLRAGMQGYADLLTHTLVVSDACESGPSFFTAMRAVNEEPSCDDIRAKTARSAQAFTSSNTELASDFSQFTRTFASTLANNRNACIPIETIVKSVSNTLANYNQQRPKFGRIMGFEDENGSFFFIPK